MTEPTGTLFNDALFKRDLTAYSRRQPTGCIIEVISSPANHNKAEAYKGVDPTYRRLVNEKRAERLNFIKF